MGFRLEKRRAIVSGIDSILGWDMDKGVWIGTLSELSDEVRRQGYAGPSDYLMRKVLLGHGGEKFCRGYYRITRKKFMED